MKHARNEVTVEGAVELPRVLETLESLVQALKAGPVEVRNGEDAVVLGPRGILGFQLSAKEKGKRQRLSLEFTWRKYDAAETDFDLTIRPGPSPALARAISDYATAASGSDGEAAEVEEDDAKEAAGEEHEGEKLQRADVYMQHPRGSNNRTDE